MFIYDGDSCGLDIGSIGTGVVVCLCVLGGNR